MRDIFAFTVSYKGGGRRSNNIFIAFGNAGLGYLKRWILKRRMEEVC